MRKTVEKHRKSSESERKLMKNDEKSSEIACPEAAQRGRGAPTRQNSAQQREITNTVLKSNEKRRGNAVCKVG